MNKILNKDGITLVEILIAITVFSAVMIIATSMIIQSFSIINRSSEQVSTKQLAEIMLEDITNNLRKINNYDADEFNNGNNIWIFTFNENGTDLEIKIKLTGNKLKLQIDGNEVRAIGNVQDFKVNKNDNRFIIELSVKDEIDNIINKRKEVLARNL